jgi:Ca2+-binding EF-hand superfamily protein
VEAASDKGSSPGATSSTLERPFDVLDKNKDGSLSRDELKATSQEKNFARLDKNSDGKLSQQEYRGEKGTTGATGGRAESTGAAGATLPRSGVASSK